MANTQVWMNAAFADFMKEQETALMWGKSNVPSKKGMTRRKMKNKKNVGIWHQISIPNVKDPNRSFTLQNLKDIVNDLYTVKEKKEMSLCKLKGKTRRKMKNKLKGIRKIKLFDGGRQEWHITMPNTFPIIK